MTFTAAVARGSQAIDAMAAALSRPLSRGQVTLIQHGGLAVAWSTSCRWLTVHDDGDVLVLVDGVLHTNPHESLLTPASLLARRYREVGDRVAVGMLGDFVVIILDRRSQSLLVARDPLGVRPWYQARSGDSHAGASDVATLVSLPWVDTRINETTALAYLSGMWVSRGETWYQGVGTLAPGATWTISSGGRSTDFAHHQWHVEPELDISWDDAAQRCRDRLDQAVGDRLRSDQPATSELSGGLDSSAVIGTAVQLGRRDVAAGRLIFEGPRADERVYSDAVIDFWGVEAVSALPWVPSADETRELERVVRQPSPAPQFTMFAGLYRALLLAGRPETLTGLGGDDAFVGMSNGSRVVSAFQLRQRREQRQLASWAVRHPRLLWRELLGPTLQYLAPRKSHLPAWVRYEAARATGVLDLLREPPHPVTGVAAIDSRFANVTSGYDAFILEESALVHDWIGVRVSHPFLDPRVIEATYGLDPWWPSYYGHTRALQVAAYRDRLPPLVAARRSKAEFSDVFWPQVLDPLAINGVREGPLAQAGWLAFTGYDALVRNAKERKAYSAIPLFRCIALDRWMRST